MSKTSKPEKDKFKNQAILDQIRFAVDSIGDAINTLNENELTHRNAVNTMLKEAAKAAKESRWKKGQRTGPSIEYTDVSDCTIVLTYKEFKTARYVSIVYKIKSNKYCIVNLSAELGLEIEEIEDISAVNIKDTVDKLRKVLMPGYLNIIEMETQLKMKEERNDHQKNTNTSN